MAGHFATEEWKEFPLGYNSKFRYAVSNYGRVKSFLEDIKTGNLLKGGIIGGYRVFSYKIFREKKIINKNLYLHQLVAAIFLPDKPDIEDKVYVLHLDHDKANNYIGNLKWATKLEMVAHNQKSPAVIKAKLRLDSSNRIREGRKLTVTQVIYIKKKLLDPNRKTRLKILAKRFGVSEMTLHRIRTGENWSHVKVE